MKNTLFIAFLLFVAQLSQAQLKIETTGNGVFFNGASSTNSITLGKARTGSGNVILDMNSSVADETAGYGFRFLRTSTGSSRFIHKGTGQYQFLADDLANVTFWINGSQLGVWRHTTGDFEVRVGNAFKLGGGPFAALSDKRLKRNVKEYADGLNEVMQLNPVTFKYTKDIDPKAKNYVGVIAQEVQQVAPYMTENTDVFDDNDKSKGTYLSIDPNAFTYMLINAVQEQQYMIEARDKQLDDMQSQVDQLNTKMDELLSLLVAENSTENIDQVTLIGSQAVLGQNEPNPFNDITRISYKVPTGVNSAYIKVVDTNGAVMKIINVNGEGKVEIKTQDLPAGNYFYSLFVDNQLVNTKKMLFNK